MGAPLVAETHDWYPMRVASTDRRKGARVEHLAMMAGYLAGYPVLSVRESRVNLQSGHDGPIWGARRRSSQAS